MSGELIPLDRLEKIKGWKTKLSPQERDEVVSSTNEVGEVFESLGRGRTRLGEVFLRMNLLLEPKRMYRPWVQLIPFGLHVRTTYTYIGIYEHTKRSLPTNYMRIGLAMNMDKINLTKVRAIPPPRTNDPGVIREYLENVQDRPARDPEQDPVTLQRIAFNGVRICYEKLGDEFRDKHADEWMNGLFGKILTLRGVSTGRRITPEAIPIDWQKGRGRPPKQIEAQVEPQEEQKAS